MRSIEKWAGWPAHPVELFRLGRVLIHCRRGLLPLNHLLLKLKPLVLLILSFPTNVDAVADVRVGEPVMGVPVNEVISHLKRSVRRELLLALWTVGRNHMETGGGQHRFEPMRALPRCLRASGEKPTHQYDKNGRAAHGSFIHRAAAEEQGPLLATGLIEPRHPREYYKPMIKRPRRGFSILKGPRPVVVFWIAALLIAAPATFAQSYKVDAADSQSLTTYLRQHRLPLVGAQVLGDAAGNRRIVLYGFVATDFGKNDAANKALAYIQNSAQAGTAVPQVENRIEVRPEIARMKTHAAAAGTTDSGNESLDQVLDDIDRYGVTMAPGERNPQ